MKEILKKLKKTQEDKLFSKLLKKEINYTLKRVGFYGTILGILTASITIHLHISGTYKGYLLPAVWTLISSALIFSMYYLAKREEIKGFAQYLVFIPLISLPTLLYLLAYALTPSGAASYIHGASQYVYFFACALAGVLFSFRFALFAGLLAGTEYFLMYLLAKPELANINADDPILLENLTGMPSFIIKSILLIFTGLVVGIISSNSKRLMKRVIYEERKNSELNRIFGTFLSPAVKEKIISEKKDVIGERKRVAVLFADIRNFTSYSETKSPEKIVNQLNEYFDRMVVCITSIGGIIDKLRGDEIMAAFGGLVKIENPCRAALDAAVLMNEELSKLNQKWQKEGLEGFRHGIGIAFGEVLQGTIGSAFRKDFTVIGDTVNTAARLEKLSKKFEPINIIFTEEVFMNISENYSENIEYLGESEIRGKKNSVKIYGKK